MDAELSKRRDAIRTLLRSQRIGTQEELGELLAKKGFEVTQATLSRDLAKLHARRVTLPEGGSVYELEESPAPPPGDDLLADVRQLVLNVDYTVWGWTHLILGIAIFLAGVGVLSGNLLGRTVGVVLAGLSALTNLLFAQAAPVWAVVIIILDFFVIYALIVHGREMEG